MALRQGRLLPLEHRTVSGVGWLSEISAAIRQPAKVFLVLHKTAEKSVRAQNVITGMLKQQAAK